MSTQQKVLILAVYSLVLASTVYFLSPTKTVTVTKTEIKEVIKEVQASNTHYKQTIKKNKDGSSLTETIADNTTNTTTDSTSETKTETTKEVTRSSNGPTIGVLAGLNVTRPQDGYFFAGQISFPVPILPIALVVQAASNKTAMLGLTLKLP